MFFNRFTSHPDLVEVTETPDLPATYDPTHPESGATTAEYGILAGGVMIGGGILYEILTSDFFEDLVHKIFEFLGDLIIKTIEQAVSGVIMLPGLF